MRATAKSTTFAIARAVVFFAALLTVAGCASTGTKIDPRTASFAQPEFTPLAPGEFTLSGGSKVFLLENRDLPLVRLRISFRGGAVHDPEGREGLSGVTGSAWRTGGTTKHTPEEFDDLLESGGIELGLMVGREFGGASLSVLVPDLDRGLDLLAALIFTPAFDPERFEWTVAKKLEALAREEDSPATLAYRELRRVLYEGHVRGRHPTAETVGMITREEAIELRRRLVEESAWTFGAEGDFDSATLVEKLEARFGALKGDSEAFGTPPPPPKLKPRLVMVDKMLAQTTLVWAGFGPTSIEAGRVPLTLADFVLGGGGFQSRLSKKIRIERGLAYSVGSFYSAYKEFGVLGMQAQTGTDSTATVWGLMTEELARLGSGGVTEGELELARETIANRHIFRFRDPLDIVAERMSLHVRGLPADLTERFYVGLGSTDLEDVGKAAATHYLPNRGVWVLVGDLSSLGDDFAPGWEVEVVELP
jgi:zinc protease